MSVSTDSESGTDDDYYPLAGIRGDDMWLDVFVTVDTVWDDTAGPVAQAGLVADDTGKTKFVTFDDELETLVEGGTYALEGVVTEEYNGRYEIKLIGSHTDVTKVGGQQELDRFQGDGEVPEEPVEEYGGLFCECGGLIQFKKGQRFCPGCGDIPEETPDGPVLIDEQEIRGSLEAADEEVGPTTDVTCPECGHDQARWEMKQIRSADESETRFFTCVECDHKWREDDH